VNLAIKADFDRFDSHTGVVASLVPGDPEREGAEQE
jgi:hypothetical protein